MISDDLSWSPQVEYVTCTANRVVCLIRRNFKECPQELRKIIYFSIIRSILEYASALWEFQLGKDTL